MVSTGLHLLLNHGFKEPWTAQNRFCEGLAALESTAAPKDLWNMCRVVEAERHEGRRDELSTDGAEVTLPGADTPQMSNN